MVTPEPENDSVSRPERLTGSARRDLLVAVLFAAATFAAASIFDLNEKWVDWAAAHEAWEVDELPLALALSVAAFGWYVYRRWRDFSRVAADRQHALDRLTRAVADRDRAVEGRRLSDARARATFDMAAVGIAHYGLDRQFLAVNRKLCDLLGYDADELCRKTFLDITHPDDLQESIKRNAELASGERDTLSMEKRYLRKDGSTLWVDVTVSGVRGENGSPAYFVSVVEDISERRRVQEALRASEERYRLAAEGSSDGIWEWDIGKGTVQITERAANIIDAPPGEIIDGSTWPAHIHPDDAAGFREALVAHFKGAADLFGHECRLRDRTGDYRWVQLSGMALRDPNGRAIRLAGSVSDITERKQAEEAIRRSEEQFRAVVDNLPNAVLLNDLEGRFRIINKRFEEWWGTPRERALGLTSHDVYPGAAARMMIDLDNRALNALAPIEDEVEVPFADGTIRRIVITKFPVFGSAGDAIGLGSISTDVTEQRRMEAALRQSQKMEAVGQLTAGVAHDFNNLLAVILGNLELIEEKFGKSAEIDEADAAAERGAALTQRLLAFSRKQILQPISVDLGGLVLETKSLLRRTLGETIEIATVAAPDRWRCSVDPSQLENALLNLAINSRDAMPAGGTLTIETANAVIDDEDSAKDLEIGPGQYVMVSVTDTGAGMSQETIARAFEPFYTTKEFGQGSGLGLSMVYGFVKQSGGHVKIFSEPGKGTTVRLYLPTAAEDEAPDTPMPADGEIALGQGEWVMVVEDDDDVRGLTASLLGTLGYEVLTAESGPAALALLDRVDRIDLLVTDVVLAGGMSGRELAAQMARARPRTKVLFMSGYARDAIGDHAWPETGIELLAKPFRKRVFANKVREVLDA